jgi:HKD family nuclease
MKITSKLSDNLISACNSADEIWIAVALLNLNGFNSILAGIKNDCKINFIGGVDLPTDPAALKKILELRTIKKHTVTAYIFNKEVYHPKVYVIRKNGQLKSFIGSANCTSGGLEGNMEMTLEIDSQKISMQLLDWFEKLKDYTIPLTLDFVADYLPKYKNRLKRKSEENKEIKSFKKDIQRKKEDDWKNRSLLIAKLKKIRKSPEYANIKNQRNQKVNELKKAIDYPNFKKIDLPAFWKIKDLGTIVPIRVKAQIENDRIKFTKLMKYICNDKIKLSLRVDEALNVNGKLRIENIGMAFISKVLVIHNPSEYYIYNKEVLESLRPFGLSFVRGSSFGEKYMSVRDTLKSILLETGIDDFAVLDQCLIKI